MPYSMKSLPITCQLLTKAVALGMVATFALIPWKGIIWVMGADFSVLVTSGSMEPGIKRGDILFLNTTKAPIRAGDIVVFEVDGRENTVCHRLIEVHEREGTMEVDILTKGDANIIDDRVLYARGQLWVQRHHVAGRIVGFLPYAGWMSIITTEMPIIKTTKD